MKGESKNEGSYKGKEKRSGAEEVIAIPKINIALSLI